MEFSDVDILGRKIFFIAGDKTFITSVFLQRLCEEGYEAYIVKDDSHCLMTDKIDIIIRDFPNSILFFNIDANIKDIKWKIYIKDLQKKYMGQVLLGVLYNANDDVDASEITNYYKKTIGIQAGTIGLVRNIDENFTAILEVLKQTGARGRRSNIRAICDTKCKLEFLFNGKKCNTSFEDINITHFRCVSTEDIGIKIFDKVRGAKITVNGFHFTSDAVLIMKRTKGNYVTYIFMFIHDNPKDTPELDDETRSSLNRNIYELISSQNTHFLNNEFRALKQF